MEPRAEAQRAVLFRSEPIRSEEHTSELQSQSNLVCRLLLEKKKELVRLDLNGTMLKSIHSHNSFSDLDLKTPHHPRERDKTLQHLLQRAARADRDHGRRPAI